MSERTLSSHRAYEGRLVSLRVDEVEVADGRRTRREVVEHPGAVGILAWDGARVAMVRQWRHAAGAALLEIPAGTLEPGEAATTAAARELAEEVGVEAGSWEPGPSFFTAPGFCTERLTLFVASGLRPAPPAAGPDDEEIEIVWLALGDAIAAIDGGEVIDAKSIAGLLWLARREVAR